MILLICIAGVHVLITLAYRLYLNIAIDIIDRCTCDTLVSLLYGYTLWQL